MLAAAKDDANAECIACVDRGLEMGRGNGVHVWDMLLCSQGSFASQSSGNAELARGYLDRMEHSLSMSRPMDHAIYCYHSAWYRFTDGNLGGARELAHPFRRRVQLDGIDVKLTAREFKD